MSFAGNFGPAIDGGMSRRDEAVEDAMAQREASAILAAEAALDDGPSNAGAGWTGPPSHFPTQATAAAAGTVEMGEHDSQLIGDDLDGTEPTVNAVPVAQARPISVESSDEDEQLASPPQANAPAATAAEAPTTMRRKAWSRVYLYCAAVELAKFVEEHDRAIYTQKACWTKDMKVIASNVLARAQDYELEHGEDVFGPITGVQNPSVANSLKLGAQKVMQKRTSQAGRIDVEATKKANADQFRSVEELVAGKTCLARATAIDNSRGTNWKTFTVPEDTLKMCRPQAGGAKTMLQMVGRGENAAPVFHTDKAWQSLIDEDQLSSAEPLTDEQLVQRCIYGYYSLQHFTATSTTWGKNSVAHKLHAALWKMKTDIFGWRYKRKKASRVVLSQQQRTVAVASTGAAGTAAAANVTPGKRAHAARRVADIEVSPGGSTAQDKLEWARKQREHKDSEC